MCSSQHVILNVVRDSVCAGDDVDAPHAARFTVGPDATLAGALFTILNARYLAAIAGGRATWTVESHRQLAVVAQQWKGPRFLIDPETPIANCITPGDSESLHFRYQ